MRTCKSGHKYAVTDRRGCPACAKARQAERRLEILADPVLAAAYRERARNYSRNRRAADEEFRLRTNATNNKSRARRAPVLAANPERVARAREYQAQYHAIRKSDPAYVEKRREYTRSLRGDKSYAAAEREKALASDRARSNDPARIRKKRDSERKRNQRPDVRERHAIASIRRRAREMGAPGPGITKEEWRLIKSAYQDSAGSTACAYCRKACRPTLDHIVPLSRGGRDAPDNAIPACKLCNSSKRDRLLSEWHRAPNMIDFSAHPFI